jgi:uncharacterized membrane protein YfcA
MSAILPGLLIAFAIGLTGMGGGVLTVPVLMLHLGVAPEVAVATALLFSATVKLPAAAVYLSRRDVDAPVLGRLLLGGAPGVAVGALLLERLALGGRHLMTLALGVIVVAMALVSIVRLGAVSERGQRERRGWLPLLGGVIGVEVGFSSAGAGALGTAGLLRLTRLAPARVVGTDLCFGLAISAIGGGLHFGLGESGDPRLLRELVLGGVPGALLGALAAPRLPPRALRVALLVVLLALGSRLIVLGLRGS